MVKVCPNSMVWHEIHQRLARYAARHPCSPPKPPVPLILSGWNFSNDVDKMQRWAEMQHWAVKNGCPELVDGTADTDFYWVDEPTTYDVGPYGGPLYRPWDYDRKERPDAGALAGWLEVLKTRWVEIAGMQLAAITSPVRFSGAKARCLIVAADPAAKPPWGDWHRLSRVEGQRRTFTRLRAAINQAIAPHEVDHVNFHTVQAHQS